MGNIAMEIGSSRNTAREATVLREANSGAWWTGHWCTVRTGEVVALVLRCHVPSSYTQTYQPALPVSDRPGKVETPCPPNLARHLGVGFMPPCAQLVQCMNPRNPVATISAVGPLPPPAMGPDRSSRPQRTEFRLCNFYRSTLPSRLRSL